MRDACGESECFACTDDADLFTTTTNRRRRRISGRSRHGYFTKTTGKEGIFLYGCPVAKQPDPDANQKADTWTSAFYTGKLEHE